MFSRSFFSSAAFAQLLLVMVATPTQAINMTYYKPASDVDEAFGPFVSNFYKQAEDTSDAATAAFVAMFNSNITVLLGGNEQPQWQGKSGIAIFKSAITEGDQLDHYPRTASVVACNEANTTFELNGSAKAISPNGTCQSTEYTTRWTILNGDDGKAIISPAKDSIVELNLVQRSPSAGDCSSY